MVFQGMAKYLLDTNVLSSILRKNVAGQAYHKKLLSVLNANALILMSPVVYYEIVRGLYKIQANKPLSFLEKLMTLFEWQDLDRSTWDTGAKLWVLCERKGTKTGNGPGGIDKDVLITAQAQEHNATVVTNNVRHFKYLGVSYETW